MTRTTWPEYVDQVVQQNRPHGESLLHDAFWLVEAQLADDNSGIYKMETTLSAWDPYSPEEAEDPYADGFRLLTAVAAIAELLARRVGPEAFAELKEKLLDPSRKFEEVVEYRAGAREPDEVVGSVAYVSDPTPDVTPYGEER
jgi:hypothetical protein